MKNAKDIVWILNYFPGFLSKRLTENFATNYNSKVWGHLIHLNGMSGITQTRDSLKDIFFNRYKGMWSAEERLGTVSSLITELRRINLPKYT